MDPDYDNFDMHYDEQGDPYHDSQEEEQTQTQTQTQSTQQASQPQTVQCDAHLWGYLQPCSSALTRIDFWKIHPRYTIGRNNELNQVILPGFKVSNQHCTITWDGRETGSSVVVLDLSSNGTFINGEKIGKNQSRILNEGSEIAFGTSIPQPQNGGIEDYRFVYRHTASGPPTEGLYAHYDLGTELGKGSFAMVRKAVHRVSGQWFAVKMINGAKFLRQGGHTSRSNAFSREISIMEQLEHRNICKLKEVFFQNDNSINLVLELVDGGDLLEYILKNGGLAEVNARDITYQICDALAYVHSKGVTHRDLKPENVLLTTDDPPIVKVADFGLAKVVDSLTMLRTMCGTPSYLAPEVVEQNGRDGYDNLVDSWSVGVIVFSMLTNAGPFIEDEAQEIKARILSRRVDWGTLTCQPVSNEAYSFIRGLLQDNPRRRRSLTDSLKHPWLQNHVPFHGTSDSQPPADEGSDAAMAPDQDDDGQDLLHGGVPLVGLPVSQGRRIPLQRRSLVLSQAAEAGGHLPEPSVEMIAYAAAQDENAPAKGQNKRVRADLTPVSEESFEAGVNASGSATTNSKAKVVEMQPRRSTRRTKVARMS
ncbi:CAMK/RAD53 protein kinase [Gymnopilus junonius]|uniref:CAMK/RAD53 protein kinase n=1 Tax=Gymnopilus junonius TaxID=109634 RepID=A0A9P5NVD2_GYMJU|nr:CAMK/RAD53 protein kinase [Gymnopilus junonius]